MLRASARSPARARDGRIIVQAIVDFALDAIKACDEFVSNKGVKVQIRAGATSSATSTIRCSAAETL